MAEHDGDRDPRGGRLPPSEQGPTDEEVAAIVAAVDLVFSRPMVVAAPHGSDKPPPWRFSGRWWARPVAARRERPW